MEPAGLTRARLLAGQLLASVRRGRAMIAAGRRADGVAILRANAILTKLSMRVPRQFVSRRLLRIVVRRMLDHDGAAW